jgi:AcrR family transcriptional regulator
MPDRRHAILDAAIGVIARRGVRGLRVEEVAEAAGVAVSLLYYYFQNRNGLVRATLDHANERATSALGAAEHDGVAGYEKVTRTLLAEFDEPVHVRETSVVWGEVLASAVFEPELREQLRAACDNWVALIANRILDGQADGSIRADVDPQASAERLTASVDGLSSRWLAGLIDRERARELLTGTIGAELDRHAHDQV